MKILIFALVALLLPTSFANSQLLPIEHVAAGTPYSAVGRVHQGTGGHCTGVLVARNKAITAAHCLYNRRTGQWLLPNSIHFLLGYDRGSYGFHTRVTEYETGDFDPARIRETIGNDWALLTLEEDAPSEYSALRFIRGGYSADRFFDVVGYASPRRYALSASENCTGLVVEKVLLSECLSAEGMSGAPLIDQGSGRLIGIQVGRMHQNGHDMLVALPASNWVGSRFRPE